MIFHKRSIKVIVKIKYLNANNILSILSIIYYTMLYIILYTLYYELYILCIVYINLLLLMIVVIQINFYK